MSSVGDSVGQSIGRSANSTPPAPSEVRYAQERYPTLMFEGMQPSSRRFPEDGHSERPSGAAMPFTGYPPPGILHPDPSQYYASPQPSHHPSTPGFAAPLPTSIPHMPSHSPHQYHYSGQDGFSNQTGPRRVPLLTGGHVGAVAHNPAGLQVSPYAPMQPPLNPRAPPLAVAGHPTSTPAAPAVNASLSRTGYEDPSVPVLVPLPAAPISESGAVVLSDQTVSALYKSVHSHGLVLQRLLSENDAQRTQINQLQDALQKSNAEQPATESRIRKRGQKGREPKPRVLANEYTVAKSEVHKMYWQLMDVVYRDYQALLEHDDSLFGESLSIPVVIVDGKQKWRPAWTRNVDLPINVRYIDEVVRQVYGDEKQRRESVPPGHLLEDEAYSKDVLYEIAKGYHQHVRNERNKLTTDAGVAKKQSSITVNRRNARRVTKMDSRLRAAHWVMHNKGLEDADLLVHAEFVSSDATYCSEEGSTDTTQCRTEVGAAKGGRAIYARAWSTKKFKTWNLYLDEIAETKATEIRALLNQANTTQLGDGTPESEAEQPVPKRSKHVSSSRSSSKRPQVTFHAPHKHDRTREPKEPPPEGIVKKSWLKRFLSENPDFTTKPTPAFWSGWTCEVNALSKKRRDILAAIPDDSDNAVEE